jgi:hypothetical protein
MAVGALAPLTALAQSSDTIFLCVDDQGTSRSRTSAAKGCKRLDVGPVLSVPASRLPAGRNATTCGRPRDGFPGIISASRPRYAAHP